MIELRGADSYTGEWIRSDRWDHRPDLTGERVAVIGEGAAVAEVLPAVVATAGRVRVFQTDPIWVLPRSPIPGTDPLLRRLPARGLRLAARANLRLQVRDSWVRRQLTPERPGVITLHDHYYAALRRDNCKLITFPIARFVPLGLRTVDGIEHRFDCIVLAGDPGAPHQEVA
ncbi:hypothetical protein [Nocardia sp. NPDC050710]|uniref:hypothetical protein n=1 Tax=Nocardia sp. NPDC050710 TaxID=3157220 RepID=UPI0033D3C17C